jgi:serine/threonine protein kinase
LTKEKLDAGAYGAVYKGKDRLSGEMVAIKKILPSDFDSEGLSTTSMREIGLLKAMDHENIVK